MKFFISKKVSKEDDNNRGNVFLQTNFSVKNIIERTYLQKNLMNEKMLLTGFSVKK